MNPFGVFSKRKEEGEYDDRKMKRFPRRWKNKFGRRKDGNSPDVSSELQTAASLISPASYWSSSIETSYRISGEENGQFDVLCRSLGVSSPDDFAITPADWTEANTGCLLGDVNDNRAENLDPETPRNGDGEIPPSSSPPVLGSCQRNGSGGRGGIKGPRPSSLTPPSQMLLPDANEFISMQDLWKTMALDDNSLETEKEQERDKEKEDDLAMVCTDPISSCSLWTSNDEDSSTTTPEIISPNVKCKLRISPGSWTKGKLLGHGSFGSVYQAYNDDCMFFAVKEVLLNGICPSDQECIQQLEKEIQLLSQLEHENIVEYLGTSKEDGKLYIFLEYVTQGSLVSLYLQYKLKDSHVSAYTRQILHGLKYLHDQNIIHRDIKCANILVAANGSVKLADFGLAKQASQGTMLRSSKGTVFWMAPEVANATGNYGLSADIWSLGCTVLEMLTRKHPFPDMDWIQAIYHIGNGGQPVIPDSVSEEARHFISRCIQVNPIDRPSATDLLEHPFVKRPLRMAST